MLKRDFFIPHDKLRGTRLEWLITDDTPIESTLDIISKLKSIFWAFIFSCFLKTDYCLIIPKKC